MTTFIHISVLIFFSCSILNAQFITTDGTPFSEAGGKPAACPNLSYKTLNSANANISCVTFTSGAFQSGAVWSCDLIDLTQSFVLNYEMNFGSDNSTGDGMAFVLQEEGVPQVIGGRGGGLGYAQGDGSLCQSTPCPIEPSVAVEFDTWDNTPDGINDLACHHVSIQTNGLMDAANTLAGPACLISGGTSVIDGQNHNICISWDPINLVFSVSFDGQNLLTYSGNIASNFTNPTAVNWGFTAASGGSTQIQTCCNVVLNTNVANPTCNAILPLNILSFDAECNDENNVLIEWAANELEVGDVFELQKSSDAINFETISVQEYNLPTTSGHQEFQYLDSEPYQSTYYRLKRVSHGLTDYTNIVQIACSDLNDGKSISIFPNPSFNDNITVQAYHSNIELISVYDLNGLLLKQLNNINAHSKVLSTDNLSSGMYIVKVRLEGNRSIWQHFVIK